MLFKKWGKGFGNWHIAKIVCYLLNILSSSFLPRFILLQSGLNFSIVDHHFTPVLERTNLLPHAKVYTSNAHKETTKYKIEKGKTVKLRVGDIRLTAAKTTE